MTGTPGGHHDVRGLVAGVPRASLPDWQGWAIESVGTRPAPEIVDHAVRHIAHSGWTLIGSHVRRYVYTVGLTPWELPELVMRLRRVAPDRVQNVLYDLVNQATRQRRPFEAGQRWSVRSGDVELVGIADDVAARICTVASALYGGGPVRAVEVVLT